MGGFCKNGLFMELLEPLFSYGSKLVYPGIPRPPPTSGYQFALRARLPGQGIFVVS